MDTRLPVPTTAPISGVAKHPELGEITHIFGLFRRHYPLIALVTIVLTMLAVFLVWRITPTYTSNAVVILDSRKQQVTNSVDVLGSLVPDQNIVRSEVDVLRGRQLAQKVADKLVLETNPIFMKDVTLPHGSRLLAALPPIVQSAIYNWFESFGIQIQMPTTPTVPQLHDERASLIVDKLLDKSAVATDGKSNTIRISYTSESPELSANIVNAWAELYLTDQLDAKLEANKRANDWMSYQIADLKDALSKAEQAVAVFRASHGLVAKDIAGTTVSTQQVGELNTQLINAESELSLKQSKIRSLQSTLKEGRSGASAPEVVASPLINQLRGSETEILRRKADLEEHFGPRYPSVVQINAELRDVRTKIAVEISNILTALQQDADSARIRVQNLQAAFAVVQKKAGVSDDDTVKLRELEREAQAKKVVYNGLLNRAQELSVSGLQQPDARIVTRADIPMAPTFPNRMLFALIGFLASSMVATLVALMRERMDNGFRSQHLTEQVTGLPCVAMVPTVASREAGRMIVDKPHSAFSEAIRSVQVALNFFTKNAKGIRILMVTSAVPEEGKSIVAISLARSMARSGRNVLLIDCDLRRPTVGEVLGYQSQMTLIDLFMDRIGDANLVIQVDKASGLHYITAQGKPLLPSHDVLSSEKMERFLKGSLEHYEMIILDCPPVMAGADTQIVTKYCDGVLFCVRWETTARPIVQNALKILRNANAPLRAVVMTRVDVKKHARYGYHDAGQYYDEYKQYTRVPPARKQA